MFLLSFSLQAEECSNEVKKELSKSNIKILECHLMSGLSEVKDEKHILVLRNEEGLKGRGIGVEVYQSSDLSKALLEDYGLGQVLGNFLMNDKRNTLLVKDVDEDGVKEFGFNVLNERSALFFLYKFDSKSKKFKAMNFKREVRGQVQTIDRLISTLDYPIEILSDHIKVQYEKDKSVIYKFKDGSFFSDMKN